MSKKLILLVTLFFSIFIKLNTVSAAETFTVTYRDWDEEVIRTEEVEQGNDAYRHVPKRIGYEFSHWSPSLVDIQEDRTVYAVYTPRPHTVTFESLDGSEVISAILGYDYVLEELNDQVKAAFNLGYTQEFFYDDYVEEEELSQRLFIKDDTIWHLVKTNYGTYIDEYIVDVEGYEFTGWSPESFLIQEDTTFSAQFELIEDENVVVDPEEPNNEIINFTSQDLTYTTGELLEASVDTDFFKSVIDSLVNTLGETELMFPEITTDGEDGIVVVIQKEALVYAEDMGIDISVEYDGYRILIPNASLSQLLDNIVVDFRLEIRETNEIVNASYDLGDYTGTPVEIMEINLLGSTVPISDYEVEVHLDSDHAIVALNDGVYSLLDSEDRRIILNNNSVLIKSNLSEKSVPVTPTRPETDDEFDPLEWLKDLEVTTIILYSLGSYVIIYLLVYLFEVYRGKTKNEL